MTAQGHMDRVTRICPTWKSALLKLGTTYKIGHDEMQRQAFHTDEPWIRQGALTKGKKCEMRPPTFHRVDRLIRQVA